MSMAVPVSNRGNLEDKTQWVNPFVTDAEVNSNAKELNSPTNFLERLFSMVKPAKELTQRLLTANPVKEGASLREKIREIARRALLVMIPCVIFATIFAALALLALATGMPIPLMLAALSAELLFGGIVIGCGTYAAGKMLILKLQDLQTKNGV